MQTELAEHAKQYVDSLSSLWPRVVVHGIKGGTDPAGEAQKTGQDLVSRCRAAIRLDTLFAAAQKEEQP